MLSEDISAKFHSFIIAYTLSYKRNGGSFSSNMSIIL